MAILKVELDRLLEGGFIVPVTNMLWVSPIVVVPKWERKWRICKNYKTFNRLITKGRQPISFIDQELDKVLAMTWFPFVMGMPDNTKRRS